MDSYELNKIIGAILGTLLFVMGVGFLAEAIYHPIMDNGPGYALPVGADTGSGDTTTPAAPVAVSIGTLLASADPVAGEASAKKCQACHDFTKGGPNKTGPNLYDIVGEQIAATPGFSFSAALQAHASRNLDVRKPQPVADLAQGLCARHQDGLCGHQGRQRARQRDRLSVDAVGIRRCHSRRPMPPARTSRRRPSR